MSDQTSSQIPVTGVPESQSMSNLTSPEIRAAGVPESSAKIWFIRFVVGIAIIGVIGLIAWLIWRAVQDDDEVTSSASPHDSATGAGATTTPTSKTLQPGGDIEVINPLGNFPDAAESLLRSANIFNAGFAHVFTEPRFLRTLAIQFSSDNAHDSYKNSSLVISLYRVLARAEQRLEGDASHSKDGYYVTATTHSKYPFNEADWPMHGVNKDRHRLAKFSFTQPLLIPTNHMLSLHIVDENDQIQIINVMWKQAEHSPHWVLSRYHFFNSKVTLNNTIITDATQRDSLIEATMQDAGLQPTDHLPLQGGGNMRVPYIKTIDSTHATHPYNQINSTAKFEDLASVRGISLGAEYKDHQGIITQFGVGIELGLSDAELK